MRRFVPLLTLVAVGALPDAAHAEDVQHVASVTFSPIHLILPVVELTGEFKVHKDLGIAAIFGVGSIKVTETTTVVGPGGTSQTDTVRFSVWELGTQFRWYVVGSFDHGMELGAEVMYLHVAGTSSVAPTVSGVGTGFAAGPFVGYKIATNFGFTFDAQLGAQWVGASASAKDSSSGDATSKSNSTVVPLLNLQVGWSF
jgi:hypothetical protein